MVRAYHFLRDNFTAGSGSEAAWTIGEERTYEGEIILCQSGYHSAPSWYDALQYAPGTMACIVEVSEPVAKETDKQVSKTRKLIVVVNVHKELALWACDCTERALTREREAGREPDERLWAALSVARRYVAGEATEEELTSAIAAARAARTAEAAAWAAEAAARAAARAAEAAAWAARAAARAAEIEWQRRRLDEIMAAAFAAAEVRV